MKNIKSIFYLLAAIFAMIGCAKDDVQEIEKTLESSEVTAVSLGSVTNFTGACVKKFDFEAEIEVDGPMTVKYTWLRSDGATSPEKTIEFDKASKKVVSTSWTFGESGNSYEGYWQQLKVISPKEMLSNKTTFDLFCDADPIEVTAVATIVGANEITGECPKKIDFEAEITVDGPVTLNFTWLRSDGGIAPENTLEFEEAGTKTVATSWTLGVNGNSYEGFWQQLKIIAPQEVLSEKATFNLYCLEANSVELVSLNPSSPATLFVKENVEFTLNYNTSEASGVRIFGRPFTAGSPTPNYAAHASPIHTAGEGTISGFFTIKDNPNNVDQIRFQMWDADQNNLLYEFFVDVDYEFISHSVEMNSANPETPATLCLGERVEFTYSYRTNEPTGVRIFGRPITDGNPTPGYSAHGSEIHPTGEGTGNGYFTLTDNSYHIDQIRFQIYDADQSNLLYEYFVNVDYTYIAHKVVLDRITTSPSTLTVGQSVKFEFDYKTNEPSGVRIFGRPFTNGNPTPDYSAHASSIYPEGEGNGNGFFNINSPSKVDQVRFQMWDANQSTLLYEYFVNVDYKYTD